MTPDGGPHFNLHQWLNFWLHKPIHPGSAYAVLYPGEVRQLIEEHDKALDSRDELRDLLIEKIHSDRNYCFAFLCPGTWE